MHDPTHLNASQLAAAVNARQLKCVDIIDAHLKRIKQINPQVNAITHTLSESALSMATAMDANPVCKPLAGVPFTVKGNIDLYGSPTHQGIPAFASTMPLANAPIVDRMIAAGAIPIARTNLPELAMRLCTDNPLFGATLNPWNEYLTPGGSSGGDAVAIATGMAPVGLGNDTGGSLRSPAYCCGVAALKPTVGRMPTVRSTGPKDMGLAMEVMQVEGPMARSVADLRTLFHVLSGHHPGDIRSQDQPLTGPAYQQKIGLVSAVPGVTLPSVTQNDIDRIGTLLTDAGYEVESVELPQLNAVNNLWGDLLATDLQHTIRTLQPVLSRPVHLFLVDMVRAFDTSLTREQLLDRRSQLQSLWAAQFERTPCLVTPTWTQLPWPVDADLDPIYGIPLLRDTTATVTPANILGFPAIALPTGVADGIPTGIQIMAPWWREDICLDIAQVIEHHCPMPTPITPS